MKIRWRKSVSLLLTVLMVLSIFTVISVTTAGAATETVTDVLTASDFNATGTTYTDFSGVKKTSDAVYAGQSAKDNNGNIQCVLRTAIPAL